MSALFRVSPRDARQSRHIRVAFAIALGPALVLSACSFATPYQRPETPVVTSYDGAERLPTSDTVPVRTQWWRDYRDSTLDALVDASLAHNNTLASAIASVEAARGTAEKAGAAQYPALQLGGAFDRAHQGGRGGGTTRTQSVFLEASYEVDFWGRNAATADSAAWLARASEFDRDTVALTLTASVVDTYFQVQALHRRLSLANTIAADADRILRLLLAQRDAGVATDLQVEQQRNALATFQAAIPTLQEQLDTALHALAVLAGQAPEHFDVTQTPLAQIPIPLAQTGLPAKLLQRRPDIRAKEAQLRSANFDVAAARAAFLPDITLTADGGLSSKNAARFLSSPFASLLASLTAPIFDGGALRGQLHASQGAAARSVADYRQTVLAALQDVEDSLTSAHQQQLVESADQTAADSAAKAAALAQAQYATGTVDFLTVLDAQRTRYQAEDTVVQARLARLQASVSLFRALGGGFDATSGSASDPADAGDAPLSASAVSHASPSQPFL